MYRKLTADRIFDGNSFRPEGTVLITTPEGVVVDLVAATDAGDDVQVMKGMMTPGFINCHCHLELSHMKGLIPMHTGMVDFILHILSQREASPEAIQEAIIEGENEMLRNGIVAVGDICNNSSTISQKNKRRLHYQNFIEVSGFPPQVADWRFQKIREVYDAFAQTLEHNAIVPHAPYSVSKDLLKSITDFSESKVLTMHNQESAAENDFFMLGTGDFRQLYQQLNIDLSFFTASGKSSLHEVLTFFPTQKPLILVHNVHTQATDLELAQKCYRNNEEHLFFCFCPNANLYIGQQLPDVNLFRKNNMNLVLGTDSLASNHTLSIFEEIKTLQKAYPQIPLEEMLQWATSNGARALQIDDQFGSFEKGKKPGVVVVEEDEVMVCWRADVLMC